MGLKHDDLLRGAVVEMYGKSGNISETCKAAGIGRDTFYRVMRTDETFADEIKTARSNYLKEMAATFQEHAPEALETLLEVIRDNTAPSTARVNAATKIIDYSKDFGESSETEARILELQKDIAEAEAGVMVG